jgi:hypothetical protein
VRQKRIRNPATIAQQWETFLCRNGDKLSEAYLAEIRGTYYSAFYDALMSVDEAIHAPTIEETKRELDALHEECKQFLGTIAIGMPIS